VKKHQLATLLWLVSSVCGGQTLVDIKTQTKNVDFSGAASTIPARSGSSVPATCKLGEMFFNTSNAPGQNLYLCAPANTWTVLAGGGGSTVGTVLSASTGQFAYYASNGSTVSGHTLVAGDIPPLNYQPLLAFTGTGTKTASSTGTFTANDCAKWDANGNIIDAGAPCGTSGGGSSTFSSLTGGTNTAATMLVGSGASLAATGTGTIAATSVPASGVTGLAPSATSDTTNASNITSGTLSASRLPATAVTTASATGTASKFVSATAAGSANNCAKWDSNGNVADAGVPCNNGNFASLGGGTNTTAALIIGSGASLSATGTGSIAATSVPASGVTGLAASATTDTTNASNITSGTLSAARLPTTPSLVAGTNVTITGQWPNQTVSASGSGSALSSVLQSKSHIAHGDSITMGYLSTGVAGQTYLPGAYDSLLAGDERATLSALGQIGYQACDLGAKWVFNNDAIASPDNNPIYTLLVGTNDANNKGVGAYETGVYKPCHQAIIAWDALANKFPATNAAHGGICTNTGTWTYNPGGGGSNWIIPNDYTYTNGSAKSCPITTYGGPIYFWYYTQDTLTTAQFTYSVDGSSATTVNGYSTPAIAAASGVNYGWQLARIPVSAGTHTIVFTSTGPTNSSTSPIEILAIGTPPAQPYYGGPRVFVAGVPRANGDTNSATFAAYNADAQADVNLLAGDGLNVSFVNVRNYLCTSQVSGQCYGYQGIADMNNSTVDPGQLHPNPQGHQELKQAFEQAMQFTPYVAPYSGNGGTAVTTTAPGVSGNCAKWDANGNVVDAGAACGTGSGGSGSSAWSALTPGTNTTGAFLIGTGASLAASGTGTIAATSVPASGVSGTLLASNLPNPTASTLGGVQSLAPTAHQWINTISTAGVPASTQPAFSDISGSVAASQLPNPSATSLGGVQSAAPLAHQWISTISTTGVPTLSQPAFSDISGSANDAQLPSDQCTLTKYTITGAQLTAAASATPTVTLYTLPSTSTRICLVEISGTTSFTGTGITAATVRLQSGAATPILYSPNQDVFGAVGPATNNYWTDIGNMADRTNQSVVAAFAFSGATSAAVSPTASVSITIGTRTMP